MCTNMHRYVHKCVCMEFIAEVGEVSADMAAPGIQLNRLGVSIEHYSRLLSRPGAGESRKKCFAFT